MRAAILRSALLVLLILPAVARAKDEIIPTRRKTRQRQEKQNPLHDVADDMATAARRLAEAKTADTTQDVQKTVIRKLEHLIELARQQSQQPPKGGEDQQKKQRQQQQKQPKPASQSQQQKAKQQSAAQKQQQSSRPGFGPGAKGEGKGKLHTDAAEWGNLPPAVRDQLLQTQGEGFPLKYRELLRRYYRQLAKPRE